jgi:hypothetical protein
MLSSDKLSQHISNTTNFIPFVIVMGPSLLFLGLAAHALNFIKTNPIPALMVVIGGPFVGISYFIWNNGILMLLSCIVFTWLRGYFVYRKEGKELIPKL